MLIVAVGHMVIVITMSEKPGPRTYWTLQAEERMKFTHVNHIKRKTLM